MNTSASAPMLLWFTVMAVCAGSAALGVGAARRAALFIAAGAVLAGAVHVIVPQSWRGGLELLIDAGLLVALASLAWRPQAGWPLALVGVQGLIVALGTLRVVEPHLRTSTFLTATSLATMVLLMILSHAAWRSRRDGSLWS